MRFWVVFLKGFVLDSAGRDLSNDVKYDGVDVVDWLGFCILIWILVFMMGNWSSLFFLRTRIEASVEELSIKLMTNLQICRGQSQFCLEGCSIIDFFSHQKDISSQSIYSILHCFLGIGHGGNRRGRSPVEYRGNLSIRPSIHSSVSERPMGGRTDI